METVSYTAARNNFRAAMDKVCDDHQPLLITRQNERPVVMMSLEDYQALEETFYLLRSPKNAVRLMESIAQADQGQRVSLPSAK